MSRSRRFPDVRSKSDRRATTGIVALLEISACMGDRSGLGSTLRLRASVSAPDGNEGHPAHAGRNQLTVVAFRQAEARNARLVFQGLEAATGIAAAQQL